MDGNTRERAWRRLRVPWKVLVPTVAALGVGGAVAAASIPGSNGVITGCYVTNPNVSEFDQPIGALRVIDPSDTTNTNPGANSCMDGETTITWNQQGPTGLQGAPGATGTTGPQGPPGATGQQGAQGQAGTVSAKSGSNTDVIMELSPSNPQLGNLNGESQVTFSQSTLPNSQDQRFDVTSFDLGAMAPTNIGTASSGAGAGKVQFQKFVVTKAVDKYSSDLFLDLAKGTALKSAEIIVRKTTADGKAIPVAQYLLKLVAITDVHVTGTSNATTETIQGEYGGIQFVYYQQMQNGTTKVGSAGGWNQVTNTSSPPSVNGSLTSKRHRRHR